MKIADKVTGNGLEVIECILNWENPVLSFQVCSILTLCSFTLESPVLEQLKLKVCLMLVFSSPSRLYHVIPRVINQSKIGYSAYVQTLHI